MLFIFVASLFVLFGALKFHEPSSRPIAKTIVKHFSTSGGQQTYPIALIVSVEIKKERLEEFLKVIELDATGSRERENGGCRRFDVLRDSTNECKFVFYEVYVNEDAVANHKKTEHFKLWTDFKESGGVVSQSVVKADALFFE